MSKLNNWTRQVVSASPMLYRIYFRLMRHNSDINVYLPLRTDHLFFDGFPRSGNTYLIALLHHVCPDLDFASHLHTVAALKIATSLKLPVYIVIRDPYNSIASLYYTKHKSGHEKRELTYIIGSYCHYYRYLLQNRHHLNFILFPEWLEDKASTIQKILTELNIDLQVSEDV